MSAVTFEALSSDEPATQTMTLPPVREPASGRHRTDDPTPHPRGLVAALVALFVAQSVVILDLDVPVLRAAVGLVTMLALPTLVLYRRANLAADTAVARFAYAFGISFLALMVVGLAVNTLGPLLGLDRPLTPQVLGVTWLVLDVALLAWRPWLSLLPQVGVRDVVRRVWDARVEPAQALAVAALPVAVMGAIRLNNGLDGDVAVAGHVLVVAAIAAVLLRDGTLGRDVRVLFLSALTMLLATSLRGWGVTGHDVQAEYGVYALTAGAQHWSMDLLHNAYMACLSVTLLPTVLAETTGLDGVFWFKTGLQVVFAAVPVVSYLAFRRFVSRRLAVVAVAFLVGFPTFHVDMPYLVRQEVAFLFLALLLLAATDPRTAVRTRRALVLVFGLGVVVSHYSTTYLLVLGLAAGLVVLGAASLLARRRGWAHERRPLVLLHPVVVVLLAAMSLIWTGPVTGTGGHPLTVAQEAIESVLGEGDDTGSNDRRFFLFAGEEEAGRERLDSFVDETMEVRKDYPRRLAVFTDPGPALTEPRILEEDEAPLTPVGELVESVGVDPGTVVVGLRWAAALLLQVLLLAGVWWLVRAGLRRFRGEAVAEEPDGEVQESRAGLEPVSVVLGVMAALGLVVVVPSLSVEYGVLRAFLQTMLFVAPVAAVGLWWLLGRFGRRTTAWLVAVSVAVLAVLTSAGTALIGGGPAKLALANEGIYYERYITADSDEVAAERIAEAPDTSGPMPKVLAPTNQGIRLALAGVPLDEIHGRTFPTVLNVDSYLFADARMVRDREDTLFLDGDRVTYRYPLERIGRELDLVYSAGKSRVYR